MSKIGGYIKESYNELMDKVSWPTWEELKGSTYVVLFLSLILIVFLFFIDFLLAKILNIIL